jgi:hypothetical protein
MMQIDTPSYSALRLIVLAYSLVVLTGCTMIRVGYGHLDTYAAWKADEYFDLDAQQKDEFARRFNRLHEWHRYEQLPEYAAFIAEARKRLDRPLQREDVEWFVEGIRQRYARIVMRGADDAAALLMSVTPEQLEALQRQWDKDNKRYAREYRLAGTDEQIRRARARRTVALARDWVGSLTQEQEQRIVAMASALPMTEKLRHEDRMRRQQEFLQLMARRDEHQGRFAAMLRQWLINWDKGRSPQYEERYGEWFAQRMHMVIEIDRMLLPHQRAILLGKLEDYMEDCVRLAQRPHARTAVN